MEAPTSSGFRRKLWDVRVQVKALWLLLLLLQGGAAADVAAAAERDCCCFGENLLHGDMEALTSSSFRA